MPIPIILGGLALFAASYGVKKGVDASDKNRDAENIVRWAKQDYESESEKLEKRKTEINSTLENFGKFKVSVFTNEIKELVELAKSCKDAKSSFEDKQVITDSELNELNIAVNNSLEIASGIGKGAIAGALTGLGAYGTVGALASASTGTAIAGLSGAAATNATLAWLGGGSLAVGGGGMALGTAVLGGIVAGPLIAVGGMFMDSKAEENLTQARKLESESNRVIEQMKTARVTLGAIEDRVEELESVIYEVKDKFNTLKEFLEKENSKFLSFFGSNKLLCKSENFNQLLIMGSSLKNLLDIPIIAEDGNANYKLTEQINEVINV